MSDLLEKWLAHYDPIHRGWTPRGIANGVCATRGFAFPRTAGGYNLYRGTGGGMVDLSHPVGAAGAEAQTIATFAWRSHAALAEYSFAIAAIGGGGVESALQYLDRVVAFDVEAVAEPLRPNAASSAQGRPMAGGRFLISWAYDPAGQEAPPVEFRIFADDGTGMIDYGDPIGAVAFRARHGTYAFTTEAFAHDSVRMFSVRAVAVDGAMDDAPKTVRLRADALPPAPHPSALVEMVEA